MDMKGEKDPVTGIPRWLLSLGVRFFFPDMDFFRTTDKQMFSIPSFPHDVRPDHSLCTGSTAEGLDLPFLCHLESGWEQLQDTDQDSMYVQTLPIPYKVVTSRQTQFLRPGFCSLRVCEDDVYALDCLKIYNGYWYITNNVFDKTWAPHVRSVLQPPRVNEAETHEGATSPALSHIVQDRNFDYVPCIVHTWPLDAAEWPNRERKNGWPTRSMVKSVVAEGCHLVSKSHPLSVFPDIEWRFSFSVAEVTLAMTLNKIQKICYKVFKTLIKYHKGTPDIPVTCDTHIPSYFLKTTFFWVCEEYAATVCSLDDLGWMLLRLLDKLLEYLGRHNLPMYFIPQNNLIEHRTAEEVKTWIRCVDDIRKNPLQHMAEFHFRHRTQIVFPVLFLNMTTGCRLMHMFASDNSMKHTEKEFFARIILDMFGLNYATDCDHEMVLSVAKTEFSPCEGEGNYIQLREKTIFTFIDKLKNLMGKYNTYIQYIITDTPGSRLITQCLFPELRNSVLAVLQVELACICYQMSERVKECSAARGRKCEEAEKHFLKAVGYNDCPPCALLKYAEYLVVQTRYGQSYTLLKKIINIGERSSAQTCGMYMCHSRYTTTSVEQSLRILHLIEKDQILFSVYPLAYYLLLICCRELDLNPVGNGVPNVTDYCKVIEQYGIPCPLDELIFFEACFLLRYGHIQKALFLFMMKRDWRCYYFMYYCVAKLFCKYHTEIR